MDCQDSLPTQEKEAVKKPYSAPRLMDLGAIEQLALGGSGVMMETNPGGPNMMKHP